MSYNKHHTTPAYRRLKKAHDPLTFGVWHVKGEDPNCDLGGPHYEPSLGYVQGTYSEVLEWAIDQHGFWQWGAGGSIIRVNVKILSYCTEEEAIWGKLKGDML